MNGSHEKESMGAEERWWQQITGESRGAQLGDDDMVAQVLGDALRAEQRAEADKVAKEQANDLARARLLKLAADAGLADDPGTKQDVGTRKGPVTPQKWAVAASVVALLTGTLLSQGWNALQGRPPEFQISELPSDQWRNSAGEPVTVVWSTRQPDRLAEQFSGALLNDGAEFALRRDSDGETLFILPDGAAPPVRAALERLGAAPLPAGAVRVLVGRNPDGSP